MLIKADAREVKVLIQHINLVDASPVWEVKDALPFSVLEMQDLQNVSEVEVMLGVGGQVRRVEITTHDGHLAVDFMAIESN